MGLSQVGLGDLEVALDHFQGLVAEDGLQGKDVAAVAQEGDGEGVAEAVGVGAGDAGALAGGLDEAAQDGAVEGPAQAGGEERLGRLSVTSDGQVAPDGMLGPGRSGKVRGILRGCC